LRRGDLDEADAPSVGVPATVEPDAGDEARVGGNRRERARVRAVGRRRVRGRDGRDNGARSESSGDADAGQETPRIPQNRLQVLSASPSCRSRGHAARKAPGSNTICGASIGQTNGEDPGKSLVELSQQPQASWSNKVGGEATVSSSSLRKRSA